MSKIYEILTKRYPQNYLLKKPLPGLFIIFVFCFVFVNIYRPLNTHSGKFFNYASTMAVYCAVISVFAFLLIKILKLTNYFSDQKEWSFLKELLSVAIILSGMGVVSYFTGFFMEADSSRRWNLYVFFDSCKITFLIGFFPFAFFTLINYRHLVFHEITQNIELLNNGSAPAPTEEVIRIDSRLKKEELSFYPGRFLYAESDGNYVVFHLKGELKVKKAVIRNSISDIEQQLSNIPYIVRTHRAFIVNARQVCSKKGNSLGYRLKLSCTDDEIPVSRKNIRAFDEVMKQYT